MRRLFKISLFLLLAVSMILACSVETPLPNGGEQVPSKKDGGTISDPSSKPNTSSPTSVKEKETPSTSTDDKEGKLPSNEESPADENSQKTEFSNTTPSNSVPCEVTVYFESTYGSFYLGSTVTKNKQSITSYSGETFSPIGYPAYREGYRFVGWITEYPYEDENGEATNGFSFDESLLWDFNSQQAPYSSRMTLYAYYDKNGSPDVIPVVQSQPTSYLYDIGDDVLPMHQIEAGSGPLVRFAKDVKEETGWYNHHQYKNMCWATTTAQMIHWYENQIEKISSQYPLAAFTAEERPISQQDAVLQELCGGDYKKGDRDNNIILAVRAYLNSLRPGSGYTTVGGIRDYMNYANYSAERRNSLISYSSDSSRRPFTLKTLSKLLYKHLSRGDIGGVEATQFGGGGAHALNLYGAEFDRETGYVTTIYVTSSPTISDTTPEWRKNPRLYKLNRIDRPDGRCEWSGNFEIRDPSLGYTTSSQYLIYDIYSLIFLTTSNYTGAY